jgi:hypothetical protein
MARHPAMHGTVSTTKNNLVQNINSAEVEKSALEVGRPCVSQLAFHHYEKMPEKN